MKNTKYRIVAAASAIIMGPLLVAMAAAPANPPSNNVSAPINAGGTVQSKVGGLLLNSGNNAVALTIYGTASTMGKVGIGDIASPSYKLQVGVAGDGSSVGSNAFFYMSDARLKNNIATLSDSLSKVLQLRGVSFNWKTTGRSDVGLIAQEVERVYPEAVNTDDNGIKAVEYGHLVGPLIEAVKAQQEEIESLKARIRALENKSN